MVVLKWSKSVERLGDKIDAPLCGGLYIEEDGFLVSWSGIYQYASPSHIA